MDGRWLLVPWATQIGSRLSEEFMARVPVADIMACIDRARAELDTVSVGALPEMVERLVRIRLLSLTGRDSRAGADGAQSEEAAQALGRRG